MLTRLTRIIAGIALFALGACGRVAGNDVVAQVGSRVSGLGLTIQAGGRAHRQTAPNVALYVTEGTSPSPFLPPGPFTAIWEVTLDVDLRASYIYQP